MKKQTKPTIISVFSGKGGTAKTTGVINVSAALGHLGFKVLIVDLDPQTNLTQYTVGDLEPGEASICDALMGRIEIDDCIIPIDSPGLHIAPAQDTLSEVELSIAGLTGREFKIRNIFRDSKACKDFDFIITDHAPSWSLLCTLGAVAANHYLIPLEAHYASLSGLSMINRELTPVRKDLNRKLKALGVYITFFDRRTSQSAQIREVLVEKIGHGLFETLIRTDEPTADLPIVKKTLFQYEGIGGKGSQDYMQLTLEVLGRLGYKDSFVFPDARSLRKMTNEYVEVQEAI